MVDIGKHGLCVAKISNSKFLEKSIVKVKLECKYLLGITKSPYHMLPCLLGTNYMSSLSHSINSSPPGQNGRHFDRRHFQMHFLE